MSGTLSDFEAKLEQLIDEWVAGGGAIGDVMDALEAKLGALEDEQGEFRGAEPDEDDQP